MDKPNSVLVELNESDNPKPVKKSSVLFGVITSLLAFGCMFLLMNSVSLAFIFLSKHFLNDKIKQKIFSKNPLTTLDHSINLIADVGFYAAIYMVSLTFTVMLTRILNNSINPAVMERLEPAEKTNELIRGFTQSLIMFGCLFLYFLENTQKSTKTGPGFYLPFWFLSGYISMWVGNLFEILFKRDIGFTKLGQFVVLWAFVILIGEIGGYKLFKKI